MPGNAGDLALAGFFYPLKTLSLDSHNKCNFLGGGFDFQSRGQTTFFFEAFESEKTFLEKVL